MERKLADIMDVSLKLNLLWLDFTDGLLFT